MGLQTCGAFFSEAVSRSIFAPTPTVLVLFIRWAIVEQHSNLIFCTGGDTEIPHKLSHADERQSSPSLCFFFRFFLPLQQFDFSFYDSFSAMSS